jgi:Zn ribbon nucleic-acid-binding protein
MWNLFNCYLSGRHDYGMWCEPGVMFLRCVHCGKRSPGWAVTPPPATAARRAPAAVVAARPQVTGNVIPFSEARRSATVAKTGRAAAR